jgi:penicillin-binding protein 2
MEVNTGAILAMVSSPAYDQSQMARGITREEWMNLTRHPQHPLNNRSTQGQYPPGSTYKTVLFIAGLETGILTPQTRFSCSGSLPYGNRVYHCWKKEGHGSVDLHRALVESCDVYFYQVGIRLGVDRIARYARMLGLGESSGMQLDTEKRGLIPTSAWKLSRFKIPWLPGETLSISIGQGYNLVTPLQMVRMISTVANGGILYKPYLLKQVKDLEGRVLYAAGPQIESRLTLKPETIKLVKEALGGVVNQPGGTGKASRLKEVLVGGKTGTAQVVKMHEGQYYKKEQGLPYRFRDHAWFVAFAPLENPEVAVAVLVEHGGHGGSAAAPIARKVLEAYFIQKGVIATPVRIAPLVGGAEVQD